MPRRIAFLFPGQGSQYVGMGKALLAEPGEGRRVLRRADEVLGFSLTRLCLEGPEERLRETPNAQPAILAVSVAAYAALREAAGDDFGPAFFAGHSLGEFSALVAAGSLSFVDALLLVRRRGELMGQAGQERPGAMAAIIGGDDSLVEEACQEAAPFGIVIVANYNAAGQVVISGEPAAVQRAGEIARAKGAKRVVPLPVSGAFHSPLMAAAAEPFAAAVAACTLVAPPVPVVGNVTAEPLMSEEQLRGELTRQIISPVRWAQSLGYMAYEGVGQYVEVGPGQVLAGLAKRLPGARVANVESASAAGALVAAWRSEG
ncbi:MAG: ACP S-malonyltransferase [Chloroflexi bacterium]|nr:ACP S-malonyltransferase [Chloroflexota bacterium]